MHEDHIHQEEEDKMAKNSSLTQNARQVVRTDRGVSLYKKIRANLDKKFGGEKI